MRQKLTTVSIPVELFYHNYILYIFLPYIHVYLSAQMRIIETHCSAKSQNKIFRNNIVICDFTRKNFGKENL